ncbi:MAG TPA: alpha/beta fold hydrolase [Intrasporangium sp.]|uniref:alpha/beta fold hydrolase n=1 Tax=Intrasporangium sp. TaxID=1925024 RepID=UPI002D775397|nr:alpha/beta fold hydrolase [Intrasporangium sp.]HET7398839.1 alpha/beta fold hydrolase [Intrasporangium sp.]
MPAASPRAFAGSRVTTPRLTMNVWACGPEDGVPLLLVHGNLTTGGFWRYVAAELQDDVRVVAPDLRGYGDTDPVPVDATRGLGDMVDDVHGLLETLGLAGSRRVNAAGWSMGAGVLQQLMLEHPDDLASVTLLAPLSPYGFGGTRGDRGERVSADGAGTGGGGVSPEFVRRLAARDASELDPPTSPRLTLRTFFGPGANAAAVDEDFLVEQLLTTRTGDDFYPGDSRPSPHWPGFAPGDRGILNTMAPTHYDASGIVDLDRKPPVTWLHGTLDQVVGDRSMFDLATLGELGAVPGWPGAETAPSQPMEAQTRAVLAVYEANGGRVKEVVLEGVDHGIPLAVPGRVAEEITAILVR